MAAEAFPPRRRCALEGAFLDELLVTTFLAPLLDADLWAQPHRQTPVLQAPVLARRLCPWNSGPVSTILRMREVAQ